MTMVSSNTNLPTLLVKFLCLRPGFDLQLWNHEDFFFFHIRDRGSVYCLSKRNEERFT